MSRNPLSGFTVDRSSIAYVGHDLQRPECILAEPNGDLWSADARGGLMHIRSDGSQAFIGQSTSAAFGVTVDAESRFTQGTLPNGLAFARNGDILISNFGTDRLELMARSGNTRVLHDRIDGQPIGKVNFVLRDSRDRVWITVSTRVNPWTTAAASRVRDGFVAVADQRSIRIVADGFSFTNEIRFDANEEWLYIVETTGPHITRMRVRESGNGGVSLVDREVYGPAHLGGMPDGIAFDAFGNLWCTLVMIDQLIAITPQGDRLMLLDDSTPAGHDLVRAFDDGKASSELMFAAAGTIAPWMASVTFGGPDLRTAYLGSLRGTRIPCFRSPVAGLPMVHWPSAA
ncbi:MAG: SMP-30/gluconolactonase/LRE family protein [Betaproteobacteria bacterium]